ncbi:MAG: AprI/Inh family metalloprotease inhibitor [Pseudolabrys sp.]
MGKAAGGLLIALLLAGCASSPFGGSSTGTAPQGMSGRWMLAAPNAPMCGMNFGGAASAREGSVSPEGGCPEKFYQSRRWTLQDTALMIVDDQNNALAQFNLAGARYEGQSTAGTPVTLTRYMPPAAAQ